MNIFDGSGTGEDIPCERHDNTAKPHADASDVLFVPPAVMPQDRYSADAADADSDGGDDFSVQLRDLAVIDCQKRTRYIMARLFGALPVLLTLLSCVPLFCTALVRQEMQAVLLLAVSSLLAVLSIVLALPDRKLRVMTSPAEEEVRRVRRLIETGRPCSGEVMRTVPSSFSPFGRNAVQLLIFCRVQEGRGEEEGAWREKNTSADCSSDAPADTQKHPGDGSPDDEQHPGVCFLTMSGRLPAQSLRLHQGDAVTVWLGTDWRSGDLYADLAEARGVCCASSR